MTFAPIGLRGKGHASKAVSVVWHETISGRKDENITSAYIKMFSHVSCRDNCTAIGLFGLIIVGSKINAGRYTQ